MSFGQRAMGYFTASAALLGLFAAASRAPAAVSITYVTVGDPGNAADTTVNNDNTSGYGSVPYVYQMGKYDVTNTQYVAFLNAVDPTGSNALNLYNSSDASQTYGVSFTSGNASGAKYGVKTGQGNNPAVNASFYSTLRFANWLANGQGGPGTTETGSYTLLGGTAVPSNANTITRNANATVVLPSENEWYKAAFYKGGSANAGYWTYATQSNTVPASTATPGAANAANYTGSAGYAKTGSTSYVSSTEYLTDVGNYGTSSPYGTFDQNGDVYQWNESLISGSSCGLRGGSWNFSSTYLPSSIRNYYGGPSDGYRLHRFSCGKYP